MTEWKNPYKESDQDTLRQITFLIGCLSSAIFCFFGIWVGLGRTYGDWTLSFDSVLFTIIIAIMPFMLPLTMNVIAVLMIYRAKTRTTGISLLCASYVFAFFVGILAVQFGKF